MTNGRKDYTVIETITLSITDEGSLVEGLKLGFVCPSAGTGVRGGTGGRWDAGGRGERRGGCGAAARVGVSGWAGMQTVARVPR